MGAKRILEGRTEIFLAARDYFTSGNLGPSQRKNQNFLKGEPVVAMDLVYAALSMSLSLPGQDARPAGDANPSGRIHGGYHMARNEPHPSYVTPFSLPESGRGEWSR